jgi:hypothetical protein
MVIAIVPRAVNHHAPLSWRERGQAPEYRLSPLFTLLPNLLPSREEECFSALLQEAHLKGVIFGYTVDVL